MLLRGRHYPVNLIIRGETETDGEEKSRSEGLLAYSP